MRPQTPIKRLRLRIVKSVERMQARRRQAEEKRAQQKSWRDRT